MADITPTTLSRSRKPILTRRPDPDALEASLWASVNAWDIARRSQGIPLGDRRISRADADRALRRALNALSNTKGAESNG